MKKIGACIPMVLIASSGMVKASLGVYSVVWSAMAAKTMAIVEATCHKRR